MILTQKLENLGGIEPMHFILGFAGVLLHILVKIGEKRKAGEDIGIREYIKSHYITLLSTVIMFPILIIIATDAAIKDLLPINYATATLAGWQTQSLFKSLMDMVMPKKS